MTAYSPRPLYLGFEWAGLFLFLPLLLSFIEPRGFIFVTLWAAAIGAGIWLKKAHAISFRKEWNATAIAGAKIHLMARGLAAGAVISGFVLLYEPARFLIFPKTMPALWAMVMVIYPLLSVVPQELLMRSFYTRRYATLFPTPARMLISSALAFGLLHLVFHNWIAVVFSALAGFFLAETYARTKSLAAVWLEHAIYGCLVFTLGLGWYFFRGGG